MYENDPTCLPPSTLGHPKPLPGGSDRPWWGDIIIVVTASVIADLVVHHVIGRKKRR